ncbi:Peptidoglycan glycosyltransferase FtsW [Caulifigura coniformis]|uniref:Probable peptidoglycan glycosyltransferase FtsW n=1 Tax=Caulifigura coniformis TaxID=2527983 RepID=A0A517SEP8_9PLAN|nr:putative peptidoglycan glycosyltransferase FtsW [Caulifigura coniformis]QDT54567.1 Peptidoglycan glycosyltransferase FtsW [Caulifigura coniformis]
MQPTVRQLHLAFVGVLVGVGVLMAFSASMSSKPGVSSAGYIFRHLGCLALAIPAAAVASRITPETWRRIAPWAFFGTCLLLVLVLIPGIGARVNGARRWFRVGGFSLQPSELMKLVLPPYLAVVLEQQRALKRPFRSDVVRLLVPLGVVAVLSILEPDLGSAVLLLTTGGIVLWTGGWPLKRIAGAALLCSPSLLGLLFLKPYQRQRLTGFVDVWTAPERAPYQIKQSLLTLGVGGWFGEGLGKGWQKLSFLPEANTDFVFSVVGEEVGLVGTLGVVGAWLGVYLTGMRMLSTRHPRSLPAIVGFTWLTMLVSQAALNICVVTALAPPKGVSHPLLSYGGTSLLVSIVIVGAFVGMTRDESTEALDEGALPETSRSRAA